MASRELCCRLIGERDDRGFDNARRVSRELMLDGLMRAGPPGRGAVQQQADDVAALLIALATHQPPAEVVRFTHAYAGAAARGGNIDAVADLDCTEFRAIADQETLGEAVTALVTLAPRFFWRNVERFAAEKPTAGADAAMTAAAHGIPYDIRCTIFRPGGSACIRLVDGTGPVPINRAVIWFDGARVYRAPAKGAGISATGEFGMNVVTPLAFAILGDDRNKDREAGDQTLPGTASGSGRAHTSAVRVASVQGEQRSDAVQAAIHAHAGGDDD